MNGSMYKWNPASGILNELSDCILYRQTNGTLWINFSMFFGKLVFFGGFLKALDWFEEGVICKKIVTSILGPETSINCHSWPNPRLEYSLNIKKPSCREIRMQSLIETPIIRICHFSHVMMKRNVMSWVSATSHTIKATDVWWTLLIAYYLKCLLFQGTCNMHYSTRHCISSFLWI